jgi:tetratricopeptide (TPR) repeat protein
VAALAIKRDAGEFAASRGLSALEKQIRAESLWQQEDAGAWVEALASADEVLAWDRERGPSRVSVMAQTVRARILAELGRTDEAAALEPAFLDRARELRDPQDLGPALAAGAALRLALNDPQGAAELIEELERVTRGRDPSQRVHELPHAARVCLVAGTINVAEALVPSRGAPTYARARLCLLSARATIAEAHGEHVAAAEVYAAAADGWRTFGNPLEEAHAHVGRGRCLVALGHTEAAHRSLLEAQRLGRTLGAVMVVGEADRLLAAATGGTAEPAAAGA